MIVYVFEGRTKVDDNGSASEFYEHSLSIHKTYESAKKSLDDEIDYLRKNQFYDVEEYNLIDEYNELSIQCKLIDEYSNNRILTVTQWSVLD